MYNLNSVSKQTRYSIQRSYQQRPTAIMCAIGLLLVLHENVRWPRRLLPLVEYAPTGQTDGRQTVTLRLPLDARKLSFYAVHV